MARIHIRSLDQDYSIRSGVNDEYLEGLARHVDAKIKEILDQVPDIEPLKAAVFAALNIADETKAQREELERKLAKAKVEALPEDPDAEVPEKPERPALIIFDEEDVERLKRISDKTKELDQMLE
jgi:cell division protein ZapA (FtsZ GTPase activity inhibitor)